MLHRQRPQGVRLGIDFEADALMSLSGGDAYSIACQRAAEASSEEIAGDWSEVAAAIARTTGKRPSLIGHLFH